ncbi:Na+/H+ antiporter subunit E [Actinotalea sp. K2]|uniref:Na+/H+ antiporter subunit E n=1 Tax=Actinotalea sp. K2 TaxID=2939438 RepID=UPI002017B7CA|nr:Na+/H+ antiporter subunit E [Actinotalea sp. K2]MCL3859545.1 Na+/H+ antiporter subunit E [Actinotalea sp. K2]
MSRVRWALRLLGFPFYFAAEVVKANTTVARDILTPGSRITAGFVELPLRCVTDLEITTMANLITLTPGTVTVAVRKDPATLWVHGMYITDLEEFRADQYAMETRLLAAMRRDPDAGPVPPAPPLTGEVER